MASQKASLKPLAGESTEGTNCSQHKEMLLNTQAGGVCSRLGTVFMIAIDDYVTCIGMGLGVYRIFLYLLFHPVPSAALERF